MILFITKIKISYLQKLLEFGNLACLKICLHWHGKHMNNNNTFMRALIIGANVLRCSLLPLLVGPGELQVCQILHFLLSSTVINGIPAQKS